jgi:transcriptional regulator GlxA family with amidase domain
MIGASHRVARSSLRSIGGMTAIAIVLFEGAEELDFAGPWEVLAAWATQFPDDGVVAYTVADTTELVRCAKGLRVAPDHVWGTAPEPDVLLVPGGHGVEAKLEDAAFLERLRTEADNGTLVTSVCTGALALAAAGLLRERPATTWWGKLDRLAELEPTVELRPDDRFVDSGEIVTAAGVSAGIDMALHLVARLHSVERARDVRRYIQYDPEPPV